MIRAAARAAAQAAERLGYIEVTVTGDLDDERRSPEAGRDAATGDPTDKRLVLAALEHLDPYAHHDDWMAIAFALKDARIWDNDAGRFMEGDERFDLFDTFSTRADDVPGKYRGKSWTEFKWESARRTSGSLITLGTLFKTAKDRGYTGKTYGSALDRFNDPAAMPDEADNDNVPDAPEHLVKDDAPSGRQKRFAKWGAAIQAGDDFRKSAKPVEMVIPRFWCAAGYTLMLADKRIGKTNIALDITARAANDMDWQGTPIQKGWCCCYIAGEDINGFAARQDAWALHNDRGFPADRFLTLPMAIDLISRSEVDDFAQFMLQKVEQQFGADRRVMFVLDTWARMVSVAENTVGDSSMQRAVQNVERLVAAFDGPALVLIHNPSSNPEKAYGAVNIENSAQGKIVIKREGNGAKRKATAVDGKNYAEDSYKVFDFEVVKLGRFDPDTNEEASSVVAVAIGGMGIETVEAMEEKARAKADACHDFCRDAIGGMLTHGPVSMRAAAEHLASREYPIPGHDQPGTLDGRNKLRDGGLKAMFGTDRHSYGTGHFKIEDDRFRWADEG